MMNKEDISKLVEQDAWMMRILKIAYNLHLPDCWIGAGFLRNKVWDYLHHYQDRTPLNDVDIVYFDPKNLDESVENDLQDALKAIDPSVVWSVTNQARMHIPANEPPYSSTEHALSLWPETPTSVAARLNGQGKVELLAPHGVEDLVSLIVNPTPQWRKNPSAYEARLAKKNWLARWPNLTINHLEP